VSDERILNASMQFDEGSRSPTYKMILGVPGRSRALETAERLGIPAEVLELARKYLSREHLEFEAMLSKLETDARESERARREAVHLREEAEKLKKEWTEKTEMAVNEMLERTRQRLRRILEQAQDEVRSSVKKIDELKSKKEFEDARARITAAFALGSDRLESALHEEAPEIASSLASQAKARESQTPEKPALGPGTQVRIPKWKSTGTVLEIQGNKVKVSMGTIQMSLSVQDIEPLAESEIAKLPQQQPKKKSQTVSTPFAPDSQLDLRGVRLDEAMRELERYLDLAYRSGALAEVTIVHGLGTGAIREGARKLLAKLPYVKHFQDGGAGRGGTGATVVEFDRD
jgi:DNA mismatch repair protein MutS2